MFKMPSLDMAQDLPAMCLPGLDLQWPSRLHPALTSNDSWEGLLLACPRLGPK